MKFLSIFFLGITFFAQAQSDTIALVKEIQAFQQQLNKAYKNKAGSPLKPTDRKKFKKHDFFPINMDYVVEAQLTRTPDAPFEPMPATGPIVQLYRVYAIANFEIHGKPYTLHLYQSKSLMNKPGFADYLFLPFTDLTSGDESYGGGRYVEVRIPAAGNTLTINFNKAYNPYCAYNDRYSCPLVPKVNDLPVAIRAGVMLIGK